MGADKGGVRGLKEEGRGLKEEEREEEREAEGLEREREREREREEKRGFIRASGNLSWMKSREGGAGRAQKEDQDKSFHLNRGKNLETVFL